MAETLCPHCGHQRSADATTPEWECPACRKKYYEAVQKEPGVWKCFIDWLDSGKWKDLSKGQKGFLIGIYALIAAPLLLSKLPDSPETQQSEHTEMWLYEQKQKAKLATAEACEQAVRNRLKAPSTAQFTDTQASIANDGESAYVFGYVDAQNAFGAMLRKRFSCSIKYEEGRWAAKINLD